MSQFSLRPKLGVYFGLQAKPRLQTTLTDKNLKVCNLCLLLSFMFAFGSPFQSDRQQTNSMPSTAHTHTLSDVSEHSFYIFSEQCTCANTFRRLTPLQKKNGEDESKQTLTLGPGEWVREIWCRLQFSCVNRGEQKATLQWGSSKSFSRSRRRLPPQPPLVLKISNLQA